MDGVTTPALSETDLKILAVLDERGGATTGHVSDTCGISYCDYNRRIKSAATRNWLNGLERRGLVARLDDEKPVCWVRTPAGTEALNAGRTEA